MVLPVRREPFPGIFRAFDTIERGAHGYEVLIVGKVIRKRPTFLRPPGMGAGLVRLFERNQMIDV
jgi:hypothetical protein